MESMNPKRRHRGTPPQRQEPVRPVGVDYPDDDNVIYVDFTRKTRTF